MAGGGAKTAGVGAPKRLPPDEPNAGVDELNADVDEPNPGAADEAPKLNAIVVGQAPDSNIGGLVWLSGKLEVSFYIPTYINAVNPFSSSHPLSQDFVG